MKALQISLSTTGLSALLLFAPVSSRAQEAAAAPAPTTAPETEVTLIPEQVPAKTKPAADEPKTDKAERSKTADSEEELQGRIHYREANIKAQRDPKVQEALARAGKARTDLEKREALKNYYTLLHARILAIDPSVKKTSDLRRAASLRRLQQTRIDPTEPLDPRDRADAFDRAND